METNFTSRREEISAGVYPELCHGAGMTETGMKAETVGKVIINNYKIIRNRIAAFLSALSLIAAPVSIEGCGLTKKQALQVDQKIADLHAELHEKDVNLETNQLMLADRLARAEDGISDNQRIDAQQVQRLHVLENAIKDNSQDLRSKLQDFEHTLRTLVEEEKTKLLNDQQAKYREIIPRLKKLEDAFKELDEKVDTFDPATIEKLKAELEELISIVKGINTANNQSLNDLTKSIEDMLGKLKTFVQHQTTASNTR